MRQAFLTALLLLLALGTGLEAQQEVRVATYNIKFLMSDIEATRKQNLQEVITELDADIIGLQKIANRAALEAVFPSAAWHHVIDDDGGERQDLALVVRKPWSVKGFPSGTLNASDGHFLFSGSGHNSSFPDRRDVLCIEVHAPGGGPSIHVMVVHAKSRFGGRARNEHRRVGTARALVEKIRTEFEEKPFVLLGDFNDNPDDASMNILEFGHPDIPGGPEELEGPFMINLAEPLMVQGHVSHGLRSNTIIGTKVNTIDLGSRGRNNTQRGTNGNSGDILFYQLLIPG